MQITLLAFAQARDALGFAERVLDFSPEQTAREVIAGVAPGVDLSVCRVAVDREYWSWDDPLGAARELALIPPVSGG